MDTDSNEEMIELMSKISVLGEVSIKFRETVIIGSYKITRWYIDQHVEVKSGCILHTVSGNGNTIEEAIEDHWKQLTNIKEHEYIVVKAYSPSERKAVRWNKYIWAPVKEER